jgi:hypothetical protein
MLDLEAGGVINYKMNKEIYTGSGHTKVLYPAFSVGEYLLY